MSGQEDASDAPPGPDPSDDDLAALADEIVDKYKKEIGPGTSPVMKLLIDDLKQIRDENPEKVDRMIQRAQNNEFDDLLSESAMCLVELEALLQEADLPYLAKNVSEGKYDA